MSGQNGMTRRHLFQATFLVVFLFLLFELAVIVSPFFSPILWAVILATATYPIYGHLRQAIGGRENLAASLMTVGLLAAAVLPALYGIILAGQQGLEAYEAVSLWISQGRLKDVGTILDAIPFAHHIQELGGRLIVASSAEIEASLLQGGKALTGFLIAQGMDLAKNVVLLVTDFVVMLFTLFFLFRDGSRMYASIAGALPMDERHKSKIIERLDATIKAVVQGTLLTAFLQGAVAGLLYASLGLPFSIFLGALSGLLSFLPIGGTASVWVPLAMYLFVTGSTLKAVLLLACGVGLIGLMDNFVQPLLVGSQAHLPVLPLFFASFGGLASFGILGLFLGPVLLAVVLETFLIYQDEFQPQGSDLILSPSSGVSGPPMTPPV